MTTYSRPLAAASDRLRSGEQSTTNYLDDCYSRIVAVEDEISAWVAGPKPQTQVNSEATALERRYPNPNSRPPLYGIPVGIKDVFHVNGLPTYANSSLPPGELTGPQAVIINRLQEAGALILGKTVTAEFAYFDPGPTRNPHDQSHTPGGSSSGSAAAVAAGMCPLALGTQTVGSIIRPATFCGIIGYKPTHNRIPTDGVIPLSDSVDHIGMFTQDAAGMQRAAAAVVNNWDPESPSERPTLGVPNGAYLNQATDTGQLSFESTIEQLEDAGYELRRTEVFPNIEEINKRHNQLVAAEAALAHSEWFEQYNDRYAMKTVDLIKKGQEITAKEIAIGRRGRGELRNKLEQRMTDHGVDLWISPGAPGTAPEGIDTTGDPIMNLPWTHSGMPTVAIPTEHINGLPIGIQCSGRFGADERTMQWSADIAAVFNQ